MRVVFDTNIFVSAIIFPRSQADKVLLRVIEGTDHLVISKPIVDELLGVLARKFSRDQEQLSRLAVFLADISELVAPDRLIAVYARRSFYFQTGPIHSDQGGTSVRSPVPPTRSPGRSISDFITTMI